MPIKKTYRSKSLKMLQARLELALSYTPNWILSPTRLPIPPLEQVIQFSTTFELFPSAVRL